MLAYQKEAGRAEATIRASTYHAEHLLAHLDPKASLASVGLADTTKYTSKRLEEGASRHLISKELGMLTQSMRRCAKLGIFVPKVDPSHLIPDELGKVYTPRDRWLPMDEYNALHAELHRASTHHSSSTDRSDYLLMYCHTGLRKAELFSVLPEHYDPVRHELYVDGTKTEEAARLVPLTETAEMVLAGRIHAAKGAPPFPVWHTVCRDLERACQRVEALQNPGFDFTYDPETEERPIPPIRFLPVTPNDLRRTFCSWLCNEGVPERVAAELMGHTDTTMVRAVYGHLDRASMTKAVRALDGAVTRGVTTDTGIAAQVTPLRDAAFAKILEKTQKKAAHPA